MRVSSGSRHRSHPSECPFNVATPKFLVSSSDSHARTVLSALPRRDAAPVRAECHRSHTMGMIQRRNALPGCRVPHPHRRIVTPRRDAAPVRAECHRSHFMRMPLRRRHAFPGRRVPHPHRLIQTPRCDAAPVRAERQPNARRHHYRVGMRLPERSSVISRIPRIVFTRTSASSPPAHARVPPAKSSPPSTIAPSLAHHVDVMGVAEKVRRRGLATIRRHPSPKSSRMVPRQTCEPLR